MSCFSYFLKGIGTITHSFFAHPINKKPGVVQVASTTYGMMMVTVTMKIMIDLIWHALAHKEW